MFKLFFIFIIGMLPANNYNWVKDNVKTSYQLEFIMMSYEYRKDTKVSDRWEDLNVALRRGAFDCEEAGMLVYYVLTNHGYECTMYVVNNDDKAHAITSFKKGHDRGYFSTFNRYPEKNFTIEKYIERTKYTEWRIHELPTD